ncbi:3'-phosphatase, 5'-polynucleotide kinase [Acidovorax phage ACPWH]|nr:3'-phosphatase, 5'-polynucleotide kinase [Acidovorax phage ACPWH]
MAVNGIELAVGQVWRCRDGKEREIIEHDGDDIYPWDLRDGLCVTDQGTEWHDGEKSSIDFVELVRDENGFTIWRGGKQPEETKGKRVEVRFRATDVPNAVGDSEADSWQHYNSPSDIVAYKIVQDASTDHQVLADEFVAASTPITPDEHARAAEMLSDLGYRWDGQAWVQDVAPAAAEGDAREYTGGSVSYYTVAVDHPTSGGTPYAAECNDLIEALGLNYAEGNVLKALWRIAAMRMGKSKRGYKDGVYDAEKIVFFGQRVLTQQKGGAA